MPPTTKEKNESLREWREKNFHEMDENIRVWKLIRDDDTATNKDRIEAAKNISKALACLQPDSVAEKKAAAKPKAGEGQPKFDLPEDEEERIRCLFNAV